jgi:alkylation response protein AidB-like acyl-CoA dehydrogenase
VTTAAPADALALTPQRTALRDTARAFAMEEVLPVADELDPRREDIPASLLERMAELGYFGLLVDAEHGGQGLEPHAGSDLAGVECTPTRTDDGGWVIEGTKRWVGHALAADFLHLLARTRPPREGESRSDGLELFGVPKERGSFPDGVTGTPIDKIGYFGLTMWELHLEGLRLPADALQDTGQEEGQGFKDSLR